MKCERCDNEASIEIKVVYKKGIKEYRLCSECYKKMMNSIKKGNKIENDVDIYKFLTDNLIEFYDENEHTSEIEMEVYNKEIFLSCLKCNTSVKDIIETGKAGCENCYRQFKNEIVNHLKKVQEVSEHKGKVPERFKIINSLKNEIKEKKDELKLLILKEEYEKAADFHDKIKDIELKIKELKGE